MESLYLLIPLSLIIVAIVVWIFFWAVKSGQFEDLEGPAYRILDNDDVEPIKQNEKLDERPDSGSK